MFHLETEDRTDSICKLVFPLDGDQLGSLGWYQSWDTSLKISAVTRTAT